MIDQHLLGIVIRVELGLLILAVGLFFAHGAWLVVFGRRLVRETELGRAALVSALDRCSRGPAGVGVIQIADFPETAALRRLPRNLTAKLFLELSRNVSGSSAGALREMSALVGLTRRARKMCRSRLWTQRLAGARILSQLGEPDPAVSLLLRDSHAPVRAQAAEWAASFPQKKLIEEMLVLLGDPETLSRFVVQDALLRIGAAAVNPLVIYLGTHSGVAAEAGLKVASVMPNSAFLHCAMRFSSDNIAGLRAAAARLLGAIGGESSADRLLVLLDDCDAGVQAEAAHALGRMRHWPAAPKLASLLGHTAWNVRYAAGVALRAIGGPGVLLLRRAMGGGDSVSADMAQLVIGLPEAAR